MGRYGVACPYDTAPVSRTRQPSVSSPVAELVEQPGFPHARLTADRHELPVPTACSLQGCTQGLHLNMAPDETGEPLGRCHAEPRLHRCSADQFEDLHGLCESFDSDGPQGVDLYQPLARDGG